MTIPLVALLLAGPDLCRAQEPLLKGLRVVRVVVAWTGGSDAEKVALQHSIELKLNQAGLALSTPDLPSPVLEAIPMLFIGVNGPGPVVPVTVQLYEDAFLMRNPADCTTASDANDKWLMDSLIKGSAPTKAELNEHYAPVEAEMLKNLTLPKYMLKATTWQRYGALRFEPAQGGQPESVASIVARYKAAMQYTAPATRAAELQMLQHMMDLEVQAASARSQGAADTSTARDTVLGFLDDFVNQWRSANGR
jgi:hypothetical protein